MGSKGHSRNVALGLETMLAFLQVFLGQGGTLFERRSQRSLARVSVTVCAYVGLKMAPNSLTHPPLGDKTHLLSFGIWGGQ